ncbi:MAG: rhodanese-like domain-containing protein [Candidatus Zixiibacteriota bacterium]
MFFKQIFEPKLAQYAYLIGCQRTGEAIVIDPMRDIQRYLGEAASAGLTITAVAETHIHADYLSGMRQFAQQTGVRIYASDEGGAEWRYNWLVGSAYDHRPLKNHDKFKIGNITFEALHTPGHTPEHMIFKVTDSGAGVSSPMGLLTGDYVFVGDVGRPDLLESAAGIAGAMRPSAETLGRSLQIFNDFDPALQVWPGHGAGSACGKALGAVPTSTVGYELENNASLIAARDQKKFVDYILTGQPEPPMYFARMKRDNRDGPAVLDKMPEPAPLAVKDIRALLDRAEVALIDTRSWDEYRTGHLPGSIFAPCNREFNTVAGCYVDEKTPMYLVIGEANVQSATIDLIRIGLDDVAGFITPAALGDYASSGGKLSVIEQISAAELETRRMEPDAFMLDVRRGDEVESSGAIPGASVIAHTRLLPRLSEIPSKENVYITCRTGQRSAYACGFLASRGYNAINLAGGFLAWREHGGEIQAPKQTVPAAT